MDYGSMIEGYKKLFSEYSGGNPIRMPSDEFLRLTARLTAYLREKGQEVKELVGGGSLWLEALPSDIGAQVSPEGFLRIYLEFERHRQDGVREIWRRSEFQRLFRDRIFEYQEVKVESINSTTAYCLEGTLDKLIQISERFRGACPRVKEVLEKYDQESRKLYEGTEGELTVILSDP
jgi:hypothetical protein